MAKGPLHSYVLPLGMLLSMFGFLAFVFTGGITIGSGESALRLDNPQTPLLLLFFFIFLYVFSRPKEFMARCRRLDSDRPEPGDRRWVAILLATFILIGFSLRIADLHEFGLSVDEAIFIYISSADTYGAVLANTDTNAHPPANFFMLHTLMKVSWNPLWLRSGSLLSGTFMIWIMYVFGRRFIGTTAGLLMALFVTWSPNLILLSRVVRNYTPAIALLITALYFLVRFFQEERWAFFYWFALFEFLAGTWIYHFIIVFGGVNVTIAAVLLHRRHPFKSWIKVAAAQTPLLIGIAIAYFVHLARMPEFHLIEYMEAEYRFPITRFWLPVLSLSRYLLTQTFGSLFFLLAFAGGFTLWVQGRRWELFLCLAPLPFAYAFAWTGKIPFGGTRHSFYLSPFLFALIASQAPECLNGFPTLRGWIMRLRARRSRKPTLNDPALFAPGGHSTPGLLALVALVFFYIYTAVGLYAYNEPYGKSHMAQYREPLAFYNTNFYKLPEAPTRVEDLDKVWNALERYAEPNDIVVLTYQALLILRFYLDPHQPMRFDVDQPVHFSRAGVDFYYTPVTEWGYVIADPLMVSVADICDRFGIESIGNVWVPHAGWEVWNTTSFKEVIERDLPEVLIDHPAVAESNGLVFPMDGPLLRKLGEQFLREMQG